MAKWNDPQWLKGKTPEQQEMKAKLKNRTSVAVDAAVKSATEADAAEWPVLVLRFVEKMTDPGMSGNPIRGLNDGIAAVEETGLYRFEGFAVEKDERTLGDRMVFYATFRHV